MSNTLLSLGILFAVSAGGAGTSIRALPRREPRRDGLGPPSHEPSPSAGPYRGVLLVLLVTALLGTAGAFTGSWLIDLVLFDTAIILVLASGILIGVVAAHLARATPPQINEAVPTPLLTLITRLGRVTARMEDGVKDLGIISATRIGTAVVGVVGIGFGLLLQPTPATAPPLLFVVLAALYLVATGLAITAARYLEAIDPACLPESPLLWRGARAGSLCWPQYRLAWFGWDSRPSCE
jgi:hypothetical protein